MKYSKIIVLMVILFNVLFASAVLYIFFFVHQEPVTLIISWFSFTTGELMALAGIKSLESKKMPTQEFLEEYLQQYLRDYLSNHAWNSNIPSYFPSQSTDLPQQDFIKNQNNSGTTPTI
ncbi:MAG: hypothetical protein AB7E28_07575 [Desulfurella sp.]